MEIKSQNTNLTFGVKYADTKSLRDVVNYAIEHGNFDKLNQARKNISPYNIRTRLRMDICYTGEYPTVVFSRFVPDKHSPFADNNYRLVSQIGFVASKPMNPLKFALNKMIKLGNNAPDNNLYKSVVVDKPNPDAEVFDFLF